MGHEQTTQHDTTHRTLTHENLFDPANAGHLAAIAWRFPTADMDVLRAGVADGDDGMIDWALRMIADHQQAIEASAIARVHKMVVKEQGEDEGGRFVEILGPVFEHVRDGIRVYLSGNEADDESRIRTALLSVVHTLREREVVGAGVEGGAV